jgi:hypothetical protein
LICSTVREAVAPSDAVTVIVPVLFWDVSVYADTETRNDEVIPSGTTVSHEGCDETAETVAPSESPEIENNFDILIEIKFINS